MTIVNAVPTVLVYLEAGRKRVFAGALEWPGWVRSDRDEDSALGALLAYGARYGAAIGEAAGTFTAPLSVASFEVVERLAGNATTDFGAPAVSPAADARPLDDVELARQLGLLEACWGTFDRVAQAATGIALAKGPRGGGRELQAIVRHVLEADAGYLHMLGAMYPGESPPGPGDAPALRRAVLEALAAGPRSGPPPPGPRGGTRWNVRYFVRRSGWHALDHAWEIGDRAASGRDPRA